MRHGRTLILVGILPLPDITIARDVFPTYKVIVARCTGGRLRRLHRLQFDA